MTFSFGGLIGAVAGLILAALEYYVFGAIAERMLQQRLAGMNAPEREQSGRTLRLIRTVLAWQFAIFPIVGYGLGTLIRPA